MHEENDKQKVESTVAALFMKLLIYTSPFLTTSTQLFPIQPSDVVQCFENQ